MGRLLYGVSPIGLGHATRAVAVGEELASSGVELLFASGGPAADCLKNSGFKVAETVWEPTPNVRRGEMKNAVMWYLAYWRGYRRTKKRLGGLLASWKPDAVVGDEEFSSVTLAAERGIPRALISDELELGFARTWLARKVESRISDWYSDLQRSVPLLIIPETGVDGGNRRYVGPIVRRSTKSKAQLSQEFGFPADKKLIVVMLSGTGIGEYLVDAAIAAVASLRGALLVIVGNRGKSRAGDGVFDVGPVWDGQDFAAAADVLLSTAGKSTIDEAASVGTPLVVIPIKNHPEQMRNAAALGYHPGDLDRLPELIASLLDKRKQPRESNGARAAASIIRSILPA